MANETKSQANNQVYEALVRPDQVDELVAVIQKRANDQCMIATSPEGKLVKVSAVLFAKEAKEVVAGIQQELKDHAIEVHHFEAGKAETEVEF